MDKLFPKKGVVLEEIVEYTYSQFQLDLRKWGKRLYRLKFGSPALDGILAVSRGGLTFAHHLAELLEFRQVEVVNAVSYEGMEKIGEPIFSPLPDLSPYFHILVVDDIADSGETLLELNKLIKEGYPELKVTTITIFSRPQNLYTPNYYFHTTTKWVHFFWEVEL